MRVAVFGGSFNPPHVGHAMVAAWLTWTGRADEVWLVPAFHHAFDKPLRPFARRVAACERLAARIPGLRVETIEASLPAPSYTIHTLRSLAARHPAHRFHLVVGSDVLAQRPQWRAWDEIEADFAPLVVNRAGFPPAGDGPVFPDVSSTAIRRRLAAGEAVDGWLPEGVLAAWSEQGEEPG